MLSIIRILIFLYLVVVIDYLLFLCLVSLGKICVYSLFCIYSRTSVARTPMARLPRLFRTRSLVPRKKIPWLQIWDNLV